MRFALPVLCLASLLAAGSRSVVAGPALDDDKAKRPASTDEPDCSKPGDPRCPAAAAPEIAEVEYGVGVRLRSVWVPKPILELFVTRAAGGAQNYGIGVDLSRRRGTTELQLGFEYEHVNVGQGVWINNGDNVAMGDEADYVLGPDATTGSGKQFGWFTLEFSFLNHAEITPWMSFRYGAGLGIGVLIGEIDHYNIICAAGATNAAPEPGCVAPRFGGTGMYSEGQATLVKYDLPPVFPVVNAILGLQFKPMDKVTINLEGGIRTLPFVGVSSSVFF
jgi:opacity protein-like surface antigen